MHVVVKLKGQNHSCEVKYIQHWKCRALVKWGICACTEWLVNIIAKHCFWNLFYDMYTSPSQSWTEILAVEGFWLTQYWLMTPLPIPVNLVMPIEIQLFSIHLYSTTCMEPRTLKHKETITNIIMVFRTPGSHTYLSYIRSTDMMQVDDQPSQVAQRDWMTGESCQDPLWSLNCI